MTEQDVATQSAEAAPSLRALISTRIGILALALLTIEAIAGMQASVTATVTPLMAADFGAQRYYGLVEGAPLAATFLTMPLGSRLLGRVPAGRLLGIFTVVTVVGGLISATAPGVAVFATGRVVSGLAAGALATVSMSALITAMPRRWRQMVLAGYSAMWVITSLIGPAYAAWISATVGWRWSLVAYLPFLVLARLVVAHQLPREPIGRAEDSFGFRGAVVLAAAVAVTTLTALLHTPWSVLIALAALIVGVLAAAPMLPAGVLCARPGRPAAISVLGLLTGVYFGASAVVTILAHDLLQFSVGQIGVLLLAGGLGWAVTGVFTARRPAIGPAYRRRGALGITLLVVGLAVMWIAVAFPTSPALYIAAWTVAGVGMGLVYLDTINAVVEEPAVPDGISPVAAGSATVVVEQSATALAGTAVATAVAALLTSNANPGMVAVPLLILIAAALLVPFGLSRVIRQPTTHAETGHPAPAS